MLENFAFVASDMTEVGAPAEAESHAVFMSDLTLIAGSAVHWRGLLGVDELAWPEFYFISSFPDESDCVGNFSAA